MIFPDDADGHALLVETTVPSYGYTTLSFAAEAQSQRNSSILNAQHSTLENADLRLELDAHGEIASLLGIAHETVSWAFTALAELGLVQVENRDVELLDVEGLRRCTRATRSSLVDLPLPARAAARHAPMLAA